MPLRATSASMHSPPRRMMHFIPVRELDDAPLLSRSAVREHAFAPLRVCRALLLGHLSPWEKGILWKTDRYHGTTNSHPR